MSEGSFTATATVDDQTAEVVQNGLNAFNEDHSGPDPTKPLWVIYRDGDGEIRGGLQGFSAWTWLYVSMLWSRTGTGN